MRERGCNGLTYTLEYITEKKKFDEEVSQDGNYYFILIYVLQTGPSGWGYRGGDTPLKIASVGK